MLFKTVSFALLGSALCLSLPACAASSDIEEAGDLGDTSDDLRSGGCALSRDKILASTTSARADAIRRGLEWYDDSISYSQSDWHEGYRTDCSGFISMCWKLGTSHTTAAFINDSSRWSSIGDYDDLQPADALVRRSNGAGHIVMFLGWDDSAHNKACVLEQASSALDMQFRVRTRSSLEGSDYKAIRASSLPSGGGSSSGPSAGGGGGGSTPPSGGGRVSLCRDDSGCPDIEWCSKPMSSGANKGKRRCCTEEDPAPECQ
jgi:hypothetical protein